jgi:hypothetical protein
MAVTLFFHDGQIAEFPLATTAEKHDGLIHVLHFNQQALTLESVTAFTVAAVALAQVFEFGTPTKVIIPDGTIPIAHKPSARSSQT